MTPNTIATALVGLASLFLAACSGEEDEKSDQDKKAESAEIGGEVAGEQAGKAGPMSAIYAAAIANPARPTSDRIRDEGREPAKILEFFGVRPGMRVVDLHAVTGYYTRLFAGVVGPEGRVVSHYKASFPKEDRAAHEAAFAPYKNIEFVYADARELAMEHDSVDFVFLGLWYHEWIYEPEWGEQLPPAAAARFANIHRMLRPGGVFGIIEHIATPDASRQMSAAVHRASPSMAEADIETVGFELEATSDALRHSRDNIMMFWRENTPRGETNRFVHLYRKPHEERPAE